MGVFLRAFSSADGFGKCIFFALLLLSLTSWFFFFHKVWELRRVLRGVDPFMQTLFARENLLLRDTATPVTVNRENPFGRVYDIMRERTIEIIDKNHAHSRTKYNFLSKNDIDSVESHLHTSVFREKRNLEKNLFLLPIATTLAPFLGLLGTVWGILVTFGALQAGGNLSSNSIITGGLSTALATTVLGLLIAIPAFIFHGYLKSRIGMLTGRLIDFSHSLLSTVELRYRKVDLD